MILADPPATDTVRNAWTTLAIHRRGDLNLCDGCYELACGFSWYPCRKARCAQRALVEAGVDIC